MIQFDLPDAPVILEIEHSGSRTFAVRSLDADYSNIALLVYEIGSYKGTRPGNFSKREEIAGLEITGDGNWNIRIRSVASARGGAGLISGSGDDVVTLSNFLASAGILSITHDGSATFAVRAWDISDYKLENFDAWDSTNLLVYQVGSVVGNYKVDKGRTVFEITADGNWQMTVK